MDTPSTIQVLGQTLHAVPGYKEHYSNAEQQGKPHIQVQHQTPPDGGDFWQISVTINKTFLTLCAGTLTKAEAALKEKILQTARDCTDFLHST